MAKQYWLCKSEPDVYPLSQLKKDGQTPWTCIRNYQARNYMRDAMKLGDGVLFYHSNAKPSAVVGLAEVASGSYPDPTQFDTKSDYYDPKSTPENPVWMLVDLRYVQEFTRPVSLQELRKTKGLTKMVLLNNGRLSVQPVTPEEWVIVVKLGAGK